MLFIELAQTWAVQRDSVNTAIIHSYSTRSRQVDRKGEDAWNMRCKEALDRRGCGTWNRTRRGARARHGDVRKSRMLAQGEPQVELEGEC